jgi:hypothetical protein
MLNSYAREKRAFPWGRKGPGGLPGLQNRAGVGDPGAGGFDSHAPSPPSIRLARRPTHYCLTYLTALRRYVGMSRAPIANKVRQG